MNQTYNIVNFWRQYLTPDQTWTSDKSKAWEGAWDRAWKAASALGGMQSAYILNATSPVVVSDRFL